MDIVAAQQGGELALVGCQRWEWLGERRRRVGASGRELDPSHDPGQLFLAEGNAPSLRPMPHRPDSREAAAEVTRASGLPAGERTVSAAAALDGKTTAVLAREMRATPCRAA